nr:MAG TPA: hypothetical protein [Caudoviricetes sp.]
MCWLESSRAGALSSSVSLAGRAKIIIRVLLGDVAVW